MCPVLSRCSTTDGAEGAVLCPRIGLFRKTVNRGLKVAAAGYRAVIFADMLAVKSQFGTGRAAAVPLCNTSRNVR